MNTNTNTKVNELVRDHVDVGTETSKATLGIGIGLAALIGIWGAACLIGGIAAAGLTGTIAGYVKAVSGL